MSSSPTRIAFVLIPRFNMFALTATIEPMRMANYFASQPVYDWEFRSIEGGPIVASNGMSQDSVPLSAPGGPWDTVFVCSSWDSERFEDASLFRWLRAMDRQGVTLASLDCGAYLLARAGLLDGAKATLHWSFIPGFAERYPEVNLQEQLFTTDRKRVTCAGGTAGLDLMLHEISRKQGPQFALTIADIILHHPVRPPETSQRQTLGGQTPELHPKVRAAIALMESNMEEPLDVPEIARRVDVSLRQLERLVRKDMGCSVVQLNTVLRLQYARVLLTNTRMSIREVSVACGFNSMSYFSRSFLRCFQRKPSDYRRAWPDSEPAPKWPGTIISTAQPRSSKRRDLAASPAN